jgi:hypothetical protein
MAYHLLAYPPTLKKGSPFMNFKYFVPMISFLLFIFVFSGCNCDGGNKYHGQVTWPDPGAPGSDQKFGNLYMDTAGKGLKEGISRNPSGQ